MTLLRRTPLKAKTRIKPVSDKRRAYRQSAKGRAGLAHMARVRSLPCVICTVEGLAQLSETQAHHVICGRYSARKAPDTHTIPLCEGHHQGLRDTSKVAIHQAPSRWQRLYGPDTDFLALTADMLAGELNPAKE